MEEEPEHKFNIETVSTFIIIVMLIGIGILVNLDILSYHWFAYAVSFISGIIFRKFLVSKFYEVN